MNYSRDRMQLPTIDKAGVLAVGLCERLPERDQAMFIAGFQEAIKFLMLTKTSED